LAALPKISKTLLLPLCFRAAETACEPRPLIRDEWAVRLIRRIDYDFDALAVHHFTHLATILRVREFDRRVRRFLHEHPGATVVNLGCGLGTRFFRVDDGTVSWFELDLPEVVALRRRLLPEPPRTRCLAADALNAAWMGHVPNCGPLLFLAEGLLPYWEESQVGRLVRELRDCFPGSDLLFDAVTPVQAWLSPMHPALTAVGAAFRWGLGRADELEGWSTGIRLLSHTYYLEDPEPRLDPYRWLLLTPWVSRGFIVLQYRLGNPP
jgi:O-methyltransferase involved in polyketide biosynthesis